ncbi:cytochrome c oxidase subunit 1 [Mortierella sp. NVP85]|nr:cytochrome c oxidase subunit 1 [Mortierella sp. NVP85]
MTSKGGGGGGSALGFADWFFSYETFKVLRVRDRRLGGIYRLFQATILIYITTTIVYQQRYLKTENIINGAVRISLKAPSDGIVTSSYCKPPRQPCLYWSENDILYQPGVDGALITTRAKVTTYGPFINHTVNQCDANMPTVRGCDPYKAPSTVKLPVSLVTDVERYTIMLEHSIRGEASGIQLRSGNMVSGVLRHYKTGEVLRTFTDQSRYVTPVSNNTSTDKTVRLAGDVMTVGEFLGASGVNLDEISTAPSASVGETVRSAGVVIIVVIKYAAQGWNPNLISYEYLPKAISDQEYKVIETIRDFRDGSFVEINRHGIRIVFSQTGQLGQFSLMALLTNLVAAVALFKVANIIVELMMLRIHPQKKVYVRAKFESTKDGNAGGKGGRSKKETFVPQVEFDDVQDQVEQGSTNHTVKEVEHRGFNRGGGRIQDSDQKGKLPQDEQDGNDSSSENDESEQEIIEQPGVRRRVVKAPAGFGDVPVNTSFSTGARITRSGVMATEISRTSAKESSRDSNQQLRSRGSSSSVLGKSLDSATKSTFGTALMDLNKNGSSSALISHATPGVAGSSARHCREFLDNVEIETRFGVLRPNDHKGFSGANVHTASGISDVSSSTPTRHAPPNPAPFEQEHGKERCLLKEARHRSRRHAALKSGASLKAPRPSSPSIFGDNHFDGTADPHKVDSGKTVAGDRHEHKKRRKECRVMPSMFKSEVSMMRPLFGLGGSSDQSTSSLSGADVKGKKRDQSDLPTLAKEPSLSQSAFRDYALSCNDQTDPDTAAADSTVVLSVSTGPSQSPTSTSLCQVASQDLNKFSTVIQGLDVASSASLGKQPLESRSHVLRSSASSPSLLKGSSPSTSVISASCLEDGPMNHDTHRLPQEPNTSLETCTMVPMDLPARYADWRFPTQVYTSTGKPLDEATVCSSKEQAVNPGDLTSSTTQPAGGSDLASVMSTLDTTEDISTTSDSSVLTTTLAPFVADTGSFPPHPLPTSTHVLPTDFLASNANGVLQSSSPSLSTDPTTTRIDAANDRTDASSRANINLVSTVVRTTSNSTMSTSTNTSGSHCYHTSSNFFTSPITASCMTTLAGTGAHVLGRTITMITADNKKLILRRSKPLILCDGVGEEKAARI